MCYKHSTRANVFEAVFIFKFSFLCFGDVCNKSIIQLALEEYEMIVVGYLSSHRTFYSCLLSDLAFEWQRGWR